MWRPRAFVLLLRRRQEAPPKYVFERELGRGTLGVTWLATHTGLNRKVVLKPLHPQWRADDAASARFRREAELLASLDHENVTRVHDVEEIDGAPHLVMEHVEGGSLADRVADGPLALDEAVRLTCDVLDGLAAAHAKGILHRDVKPSNVLLTREGRAKLADFGLARASDPSATAAAQTVATAGTPRYMAPEQARGEEVDARADLYATGVMFHEMVTRRFPGQAEAALAALPPRVRAWLARVLADAPGARHPDAAAMRDALRDAAS